mmetsp:Transcript_67168/g.217045  ORF Transcript_67168/g.217045 Transcript_67168/m.217045 type:complete len:131 (-) Transcript_67168:362-754(-)
MRTAWQGPRLCHVMGDLAEPIHPQRGLPPGCPGSPTTLSAVLAPWNGLVAKCAHGVEAWAFMDRSLKCISVVTQIGEGAGAESAALQPEPPIDGAVSTALAAALETTARFDAAVGLQENMKSGSFGPRTV